MEKPHIVKLSLDIEVTGLCSAPPTMSKMDPTAPKNGTELKLNKIFEGRISQGRCGSQRGDEKDHLDVICKA